MRSLALDRMRPEDLEEVLAIERASFTMPWSRGAFLYELQQNRVARCWVARGAEGDVVGYLCLWEVADEVHITNIAVRPECRRRGLARLLLGGILDEARQRRIKLVVLEVRPSNTEARTLYEDLTPDKPAAPAVETTPAAREKGAGRPTKKDRRAIARLHDSGDSD